MFLHEKVRVFFPPSRSFRSAVRNCDNPTAQGGGNDLSKVTGRGWGEEKGTIDPTSKEGRER